MDAATRGDPGGMRRDAQAQGSSDIHIISQRNTQEQEVKGWPRTGNNQMTGSGETETVERTVRMAIIPTLPLPDARHRRGSTEDAP
ncbi:hypothetical protein [Granulibacter bethesdensis]|uniref:hypothetical protein n=1 Tax=Granulibacter bethesdensis TaxID=364410 RepID=UPI0009330E7A|nr:hypothetical protein [Granulibacter bethesdensis]